MRTRVVGDGKMVESECDALREIVASRNINGVCPRCGGDILFVERGNSHAIWCSAHPTCKVGYVMRGI